MGLRKKYIDFIFKNITSVAGKEILELGNQYIRKDGIDEIDTVFKTGKEYWTSLGAIHTSIDKNGEDGTLIYDLIKPILNFDDKFDIVIDIGTTCYTGNLEACHKNLIRMTKPGGVIFQFIPEKNSNWTAEEYIDLSYVNDLAKRLNVKKIEAIIIFGLYGNLISFCMEKVK